jgi:hypothetical protein
MASNPAQVKHLDTVSVELAAHAQPLLEVVRGGAEFATVSLDRVITNDTNVDYQITLAIQFGDSKDVAAKLYACIKQAVTGGN